MGNHGRIQGNKNKEIFVISWKIFETRFFIMWCPGRNQDKISEGAQLSRAPWPDHEEGASGAKEGASGAEKGASRVRRAPLELRRAPLELRRAPLELRRAPH